MAGRDPPRLDDPDDWFGELEPGAPPARSRHHALEARAASREQPGSGEDWLDREPEVDWDDAPETGFTIKLGTLLAVAVVVVLLIVAGLAVGGVFSGSKHPAASPPTVTAQTTTSTPTTTPTTTARSTSSLPAPSTTLKPGDQGAQVKVLQRALARLGYATGAVDGDYGPSTEDALKRFQTASKLTADGVLGPATLKALKLALQRHG
jgi:hypothetical protein